VDPACFREAGGVHCHWYPLDPVSVSQGSEDYDIPLKFRDLNKD